MNCRLFPLWLCLSFVAATFASADVSPPRSTVTFAVDGLEQPVEILIDTWGVPHIYARSQTDAFLAQGFNAARDRLWQIDTWRRRGLGRLSEVLGVRYVAQDRAARLFLYRDDLYREWLAYGSDAKQIAEAFVAGINAYVALTESRPICCRPNSRRWAIGPRAGVPTTWSEFAVTGSGVT